MFTVYKITNKINNKCYIGSSIRTEKRWKQHINASNNPNSPHYNYPLYQAFRKYGIDNFKFEILEQRECGELEIREIESNYIKLYNIFFY